jgi:hypothetical protein
VRVASKRVPFLLCQYEVVRYSKSRTLSKELELGFYETWQPRHRDIYGADRVDILVRRPWRIGVERLLRSAIFLRVIVSHSVTLRCLNALFDDPMTDGETGCGLLGVLLRLERLARGE